MNSKTTELMREPVGVAFARALQHLGVRNSQRFVRSRLAEHEDAQSLFAVIDLAESFGVEAEGYQCDLEALQPEDLPAILYWNGGARGRDGFGALLAIEEEQYVFAGPGRETIRLRRPEVERDWSGIAVALRRSGKPAGEAGYLFWSIKETLSEEIGGIVKDWGHGGLLRAGAAFLGVLLVVSTLVRVREVPGEALALTLLLGVALAGSLILDRMSRSVSQAGEGRLASRLCGSGRFVDCDSVLHSRWAGFRKWSLASVGLGWFLSCFLLIATAGVLDPEPDRVFHWLAAASLAMVPFSLLLISVQIWPLRKICVICMMVHAAVLGCAALALLAFFDPPGSGIDWKLLLRYGAAHGFLFLAVLGIFFPWREADSRWNAWGASQAQAMATPLASMALTAAREVTEIARLSTPVAWGNSRASIQVDVCVSPLCDACLPVLEELRELSGRHSQSLLIRLHILPKSSSRDPSDLRLSIALTALGLLAGEKAALAAFVEVKRQRGTGRWQDRAVLYVEEIVAGLGGADTGAVDEALRRAGEMTTRAAEAIRLAAVGLPAVFLAGRYFDAPLGHLDHLLTQNPNLLSSFLSVD